MPAYHSEFNDPSIKSQFQRVGGMYLIPFKASKARSGISMSGSQTPYLNKDSDDVIDEAIHLFRANVLFRHFDIKSLNDRLLVYITLLISEAITKLKSNTSAEDATRIWSQLSSSKVILPGDSDFPLNNMYDSPASRTEIDQLRSYLVQLRQELYLRLHQTIYSGSSLPNKWWLSFQKRRFMNKTF